MASLSSSPKLLILNLLLMSPGFLISIVSFLLSSPLSMVSLLMAPLMMTESLLLPRFIEVLPVSFVPFSMVMISLPLSPLIVDDSSFAREDDLICSFCGTDVGPNGLVVSESEFGFLFFAKSEGRLI